MFIHFFTPPPSSRKEKACYKLLARHFLHLVTSEAPNGFERKNVVRPTRGQLLPRQ